MNDQVNTARTLIRDVLKEKTRYADAKIDGITDEILDAITHLFATNTAPAKKLGATVLTETAAANYKTKPRQV